MPRPDTLSCVLKDASTGRFAALFFYINSSKQYPLFNSRGLLE